MTSPNRPRPRIAIHLYGFETCSTFKERPGDVLRDLSDAGYAGIESMAAPPVEPAVLERLRLAVAGMHCVPPGIPEVAARLPAFACTNVVSSGPLEWHERSQADWDRTAAHLTRAGKRLLDDGARLLYHNHEFEFGADQAAERLLAHTDPASMSWCLDLGWAWRSGLDVDAFLRRHGDRVPYVHLRDFRGERSVPLGTGDVPLRTLLDAALTHGDVEWVVVEHDPGSEDPVADARIGAAWLKASGLS